MKKTIDYIQTVQKLINSVLETQLPYIEQAGEVIANTLQQQGFVFTFGTGHSHMMAEELFYRAGGLARLYPILEEALMLHNGAIMSTEMERLEGYAARILSKYPCGSTDCLIIASNSGRNQVIIEMVLEAQKLGMKVIALTNRTHSEAQSSRHPSGYKLYELADVVLDNQGCLGDAAVFIPELNRSIGATSTSLGALLLQAAVIAAVEQLMARQQTPELFASSNLDGGDALNKQLLETYRTLVKPL
jgi:uncharacterized phosphosugar-binding protein